MTSSGVVGTVPVDQAWVEEASVDEAWADEAWADEAWADEAWTAGLEMGRLDAQLAARPARTRAGLSIRARNARAAEEIAGRHGYRLQLRDAGEAGRLWVELRPRD